MFVAGLYPSGFQQPSENPTCLFVCFNVCVCVLGRCDSVVDRGGGAVLLCLLAIVCLLDDSDLVFVCVCVSVRVCVLGVVRPECDSTVSRG